MGKTHHSISPVSTLTMGCTHPKFLKLAAATPAENEPAAFNLIKAGKAQACAQNRYMLPGLA